ncbi:MAG: NUDIX domain-containing protein [Halodesulfurarchaeum sp.]
METTRHFTATVYIVNGGKTALHHHDRLDMWLPPGGHLDRDELPRDGARREVEEETGLTVTLRESETAVEAPTVTELAGPEYLLLEDIHRYQDGTVGHQHIDFVYFGSVPSRQIDPDADERERTHWEWFDDEALTADPGLAPEVEQIGREAIARLDRRDMEDSDD